MQKPIQCAAAIAVSTLTFLAASLRADDRIPVRVVVVAAFDNELQDWIANFPLNETLPFTQGYRCLHYNSRLRVLGIVTGEGKSHAAASIMGLGLDSRFDLSHSYWLVAGIAGVDPNKASVASTAWAKFIVDGDLSHEIDARQIPGDWSTGYVPLGRSRPYEAPPQPSNSNGVQQVYRLNASLADFAFRLTAAVVLPDDANLQQVRARYPTYPNALKPPFVFEGDDLAADTFWIGDLLNTWAESWISYWTVGRGCFAMADFEDAGIGQALQFLSRAGRADQNRLLVLRGGSNYTIQPEGETSAHFLASQNSGGLSGFQEALNDLYQVGSIVVIQLSTNWNAYADRLPARMIEGG
jgi:purine nucleoside permease